MANIKVSVYKALTSGVGKFKVLDIYKLAIFLNVEPQEFFNNEDKNYFLESYFNT